MNTRTLATAALAAAAAAVAVAGCSSTKSGHAAPPIGAPLPSAPSSAAAPAASAALGQPITSGQLRITISGPATVTPGAGNGYASASFNVTMTNTGASGSVAGPASFAMHCDGKTYNWMSNTTAARKTIAAGATATGTAVVQWAHTTDSENSPTYNPDVKDKPLPCTGPTDVEALFAGHGNTGLSWTVPEDQVTQINTEAAKPANG